ncbi:bifunctional glycosyltransferase/CDP-glycerol:glycerophosphate glycerophosphotransferase [Microlunatus endophyticus]|uniref:bifunctional glycosyltransferase/CDP-glycerol:glycerophosphate glycerophosphotransferase n=1 Tax=Microlunatus endophyticus TaxID=1716077 RepID=UPI001667F210|nr:bifunctional glycosyltransferase family 2 protein/CDP-glycerol:glycerophosphate glycerophosphotransferase [Microlunatus endophyticus]
MRSYRQDSKQLDLVSIIIPIYNVEEYVGECLTSIVGQSYRKLEIIVVDDGSTDGSARIARGYARWDPRIRIIRQANRGLGGARNAGIAIARGRYLCFADSDDILPPNSIELMVRSLQRSGSDFAVGAPWRIANGRKWLPGWAKEVHAEDRFGIRLDDFPDILKDVFAWNKLFDAEFFRGAVSGFPEGIRYEDQEPTAKAYVSGRFDVLSAPVYYWRDREDGTSITQQKADPRDLHDRLLVKHRVSEVISAGASHESHDAWLAKALGFDLRPYFEEVPRTDREYFDQLRAGAIALAERATEHTWERVPIIDRIPSLAVLANRPDDVTAAVTLRAEYGWFFPTEVRDGKTVVQRSYLGQIGLYLTDGQLRVGDVDLRVVAKVTSLWWSGTRLRIEGHGYITNVPFDPDNSRIELDLVSADRRRIPLVVDARPDPILATETNDAWNDHSLAGFSVTIDPSELPLEARDPWHLELTVTTQGLSRSTIVREFDPRGIAGTKPVAPEVAAVRWMATFEEANRLTLRRSINPGSPAVSIAADGAGLSIEVDDADATHLTLTCKSLRKTLEVSGRRQTTTPGRIVFRVVLPEVTGTTAQGTEHVWSLELRAGAGTTRRIVYPGGIDDLHEAVPEHWRVRPSLTRAGTLRLIQNRWWAVADGVKIEDESITVTGRICAPGAKALWGRLVGGNDVIDADEVHFHASRERFTVRFPLSEGGRAPSTRYGFSARLSVVLDGRHQERWLKVSNDLQHSFPMNAMATLRGVTFTRTRSAGALWVRFRPPYLLDERGRFAQRQLHEHFQRLTSAGGGLTVRPRNTVLLESFNGRYVSDSVLAIYHELRERYPALEYLWSVADLETAIPDGSSPVLIHSRAYMDALHNARYLINNNNFPFYYRKRPDQTYLQTWHGTPLKRIGNDVPGANLSLSYRQLMKREAGYWDVLLAQNDFAAKVLPAAFGYEGRVLNVGYPRNDLLVGDDTETHRERARKALGIAEGQVALLYAPTWRDNVSVSSGYAMVSYLDTRSARIALGEGSVILLRGHANTAHDRAAEESGVINVTDHPDVNDLILASDVLVTDYSSIMFDYCVTGKPIVLLTPDLDRYRDVTRGFYLDLPDIAPGPICRDTPALNKALADLDKMRARYARQYAQFVTEFAPHDDGEAAQRVVDAVFPTEGSADHADVQRRGAAPSHG